MRTNIILDDQLVSRAQELSGVKSKRRVVEEALRTFVEVKSHEQALERYRRRAAALEDRLRGLPIGPSAAEIIRADRERE